MAPGDETMYKSFYDDADETKSLSISLHEQNDEHEVSSEISFDSYWTSVSDDDSKPGGPDDDEIEDEYDSLPFFGEDIAALYGLVMEQEGDVDDEDNHDSDDSIDSFSLCGSVVNSDSGEELQQDHGFPSISQDRSGPHIDVELPLGGKGASAPELTEARSKTMKPRPNLTSPEKPFDLTTISTKLDAILHAVTGLPAGQPSQPPPLIDILRKECYTTHHLLAMEKARTSKLEIDLADALRDAAELGANLELFTKNAEGQKADMERLQKRTERLEHDLRQGDAELKSLKECAVSADEVEELVQKKKKYEEKLAALQDQLVKFEDTLGQYEDRVTSLDAANAEMEQLLEDYQEKVTDLTRGFEASQEAKLELHIARDTEKDKVSRFSLEVSELKKAKAELEKENGLLMDKLRAKGLEAGELEGKLSTVESVVSRFEEALAKEKAEVETLKYQESTLRTEIRNSKGIINSLHSQLKVSEAALEAAREEIEKRKTDQETTDVKVVLLTGELEKEKARSKKIADTGRQYMRALETKTRECEIALADLREARNTIEVLKKEKETAVLKHKAFKSARSSEPMGVRWIARAAEPSASTSRSSELPRNRSPPGGFKA